MPVAGIKLRQCPVFFLFLFCQHIFETPWEFYFEFGTTAHLQHQQVKDPLCVTFNKKNCVTVLLG